MKDLIKNLQLGLLVIILISTIIAVFIEMINMYQAKSVTLADLLLMFLYLEVMAMVRVFWDEQSIRITLPLLIAITALSRFIILQGKEMDPTALVYESVAILLIAIAIVVMRLRHSSKLGIDSKSKKNHHYKKCKFTPKDIKDKLFPTKEQAKQFIVGEKMVEGKGCAIVERKGEDVRCQHYCSVNEFCSHFMNVAF